MIKNILLICFLQTVICNPTRIRRSPWWWDSEDEVIPAVTEEVTTVIVDEIIVDDIIEEEDLPFDTYEDDPKMDNFVKSTENNLNLMENKVKQVQEKVQKKAQDITSKVRQAAEFTAKKVEIYLEENPDKQETVNKMMAGLSLVGEFIKSSKDKVFDNVNEKTSSIWNNWMGDDQIVTVDDENEVDGDNDIISVEPETTIINHVNEIEQNLLTEEITKEVDQTIQNKKDSKSEKPETTAEPSDFITTDDNEIIGDDDIEMQDLWGDYLTEKSKTEEQRSDLLDLFEDDDDDYSSYDDSYDTEDYYM